MFYFRLAELLHMTVRELLDRIDSREIEEWAIYLDHKADGFKRLMSSGGDVRRRTDAIMGAHRGNPHKRRQPKR